MKTNTHMLKCRRCGTIQVAYKFDMRKLIGVKKPKSIPDYIYMCWTHGKEIIGECWT